MIFYAKSVWLGGLGHSGHSMRPLAMKRIGANGQPWPKVAQRFTFSRISQRFSIRICEKRCMCRNHSLNSIQLHPVFMWFNPHFHRVKSPTIHSSWDLQSGFFCAASGHSHSMTSMRFLAVWWPQLSSFGKSQGINHLIHFEMDQSGKPNLIFFWAVLNLSMNGGLLASRHRI